MIIPKDICDEWSDLEIVRKSLEETDYFSCLYERYEDRMLRYIRRLTSLPDEEVEDILQEAFIKAWKNLNAFDQDLKLSTWLYRIVHNHAISYLRKKKSFGKDRTTPWNEAVLSKIPDEIAAEWEESSPDQDQLVDNLIAQLPLPYKQVLTLKFLEGMSYEEISDVLQIPEGTVATRINRAKKAFAKLAAHKHLTFDR